VLFILNTATSFSSWVNL